MGIYTLKFVMLKFIKGTKFWLKMKHKKIGIYFHQMKGHYSKFQVRMGQRTELLIKTVFALYGVLTISLFVSAGMIKFLIHIVCIDAVLFFTTLNTQWWEILFIVSSLFFNRMKIITSFTILARNFTALSCFEVLQI